MTEFKLLENLIPESYSNLLKNEFENNIPWFWSPSASGVQDNFDINNPKIRDSMQYIHGIYWNDGPTSDYYQLVLPIVWFLEKETNLPIEAIARIKANDLPKLPDSTFYNPPHVDSRPGFASLIYYVNDSDGDTVIFDKFAEEGHWDLKEVARFTPKKGNALLLPSHQFHTSTNPEKSDRRIVINFVLKLVENA